MVQPEPGNQANIEYFFRLLYEWLFGKHEVDFSALKAFFAHLWIWVTVVGYLLAVAAFFVIVYVLVRLFELRKREHAYYTTLIPSPEATGGENPRWQHIQSLIAGDKESEWREAILEADIMLDDALARKGYVGEGVGEKLNAVDSQELASLQNAWDAHKVRNQIAHQGSMFKLSQELAGRTIAHFETVFRELNEL